MTIDKAKDYRYYNNRCKIVILGHSFHSRKAIGQIHLGEDSMDINVLITAPVVEIDGVKYHHHPNGGGMVSEQAQVADTVYVGPFAKICGHCKLSGEAFVFGNAWIFDKAEVSGSAEIFGNARVFGNAKITGDAKVYGFSVVYGDAVVSGVAEVSEKAEVGGNARINNARIGGESKILGEAVAKKKVA